jgi:PilZ domain-containing protein
MPEHRLFHRIRFVVKTDIEINGKSCEAVLVDISLKGALITFPDELHPETGLPCQLTIHLDDSDIKLTFSGEVIHTHENLTGIKFTLIDLDSMIHLRRLLELNSTNPDQVRSELNSLIGQEEHK